MRAGPRGASAAACGVSPLAQALAQQLDGVEHLRVAVRGDLAHLFPEFGAGLLLGAGGAVPVVAAQQRAVAGHPLVGIIAGVPLVVEENAIVRSDPAAQGD